MNLNTISLADVIIQWLRGFCVHVMSPKFDFVLLIRGYSGNLITRVDILYPGNK